MIVDPLDDESGHAPQLEEGARQRFDAVLDTIAAREAHRRAERFLWHAHHWPDEYERCVMLGDRPVCRRCLILYPLALATAVLSLAGVAPWPTDFDLFFIWGLCLPATVDFVLEQTGVVAYSVRRQVATTVLLAPALGRGFGHELDERWSGAFWGPVLTFCTIWFLAAMVGRSRRARRVSA